jgi:hypothetical protein
MSPSDFSSAFQVHLQIMEWSHHSPKFHYKTPPPQEEEEEEEL